MLLFKHVIDDPSDTFFVVATFEEILLLLVVLVPLPQQLHPVLRFNPPLFLCAVLPFYPVFEDVELTGFLGDFDLDLSALLQDNEHFVVGWHLHVDLLGG